VLPPAWKHPASISSDYRDILDTGGVAGTQNECHDTRGATRSDGSRRKYPGLVVLAVNTLLPFQDSLDVSPSVLLRGRQKTPLETAHVGRYIDGLASCGSQGVLNFELIVLVIFVVIEVTRLILVAAIVGGVILTTSIEDDVGLLDRHRLLSAELTGETLVGVEDVIALIPGPE